MANLLILGILVVGGIVGWTLFFLTVAQTYISRSKEMALIAEIRQDIKYIKEDVNHLNQVDRKR